MASNIPREKSLGLRLASSLGAEFAKRESLDRNEVMRAVLGDNDVHKEAVSKMAFFLINQKDTKDGSRMERLTNRPKKGRLLHHCFENALTEFRLTGNPVEVGFCFQARGTYHYVFSHAYNRDKETGEAYDTEDSDQLCFSRFVITYDVPKMNKSKMPVGKYGEEHRNWSFFSRGDEVYAFKQVAWTMEWEEQGKWSYVGNIYPYIRPLIEKQASEMTK